ncbi:23S rRNA (guanosine(2251)-2'-O)-methyltransferase RlmB [Marinobacteraceae bacterium S3BR75-40.1]
MSQDHIYGIHAVQALLEKRPEQVEWLWLQEGRADRRVEALLALAERFGVRHESLPRKKLDEMVGGAHQGVVARVRALPAWDEGQLLDYVKERGRNAFVLVLDGVTDPHNLGACMRTADAAGVDVIVMPKDKSAALTPAARKVACGAAEVLPLARVTNLARTLRALQDCGVWLVGTAGEAPQSLYQADLTGPLAVVMGAEGKGMRRLTREHCDALVYLPMAGTVESLNVSVATGITLFEAVRQRQGG